MAFQKLFNSPNQSAVTPYIPQPVTHQPPERIILLRRPVFWSYLFASLLLGTGIGFGAWAAIARFDQTISATGNLELQGTVYDIKAPSNGIVQEIHVRNGETVAVNHPLATFKPTLSEAELALLKQEKETLIRDNQIYDEVLRGGNSTSETKLNSLVSQRVQLAQETQYYQSLVTDNNLDSNVGGELDANQQKLIAASSPELQSRAAAARSQLQKLEKQLASVKEKLEQAEKLLAFNQDILERMRQASQDVAVPRQQYQRQNQEVLNNQAEVDNQLAAQQRLTKQIAQTKEELQNTLTLAAKDLLNKISQNQQQIAQLDAQLKQAQLENQNRIAEIDAQLLQAQQPQNQQLNSPLAGVVVDLQPFAPGYVAQANQTLLTIAPPDSLVISVLLNNQDIGEIKQGMEVKIKPTSLSTNKLGNITGKVLWVGTNALPPAPERPYSAIPARIQLNHLDLAGNNQLMLLGSETPVNCEIILPNQLTIWQALQEQVTQNVEKVVELVR